MDTHGGRAILFPSDWTANYFASKHPQIPLSEVPFEGVAAVAAAG